MGKKENIGLVVMGSAVIILSLVGIFKIHALSSNTLVPDLALGLSALLGAAMVLWGSSEIRAALRCL